MKVTMNDQAWVWMDWDRFLWIVDCPDCGQLELPGDTVLRNQAEHLANLHNALRHQGVRMADSLLN